MQIVSIFRLSALEVYQFQAKNFEIILSKFLTLPTATSHQILPI